MGGRNSFHFYFWESLMCVLVTVRSYITYNNSFPVANHKKCNSSLEVVEGQIQHCLCEKRRVQTFTLEMRKIWANKLGRGGGKGTEIT